MPREQQVTVLPLAIAAWRREKKMSQADLAKLAGCSEGLIAQIETSRRQPGLGNAIGIARAFGIELGAIAIVHATPEELAEMQRAVA
jgi:transcriptional regulator with XRE-family HTH domain